MWKTLIISLGLLILGGWRVYDYFTITDDSANNIAPQQQSPPIPSSSQSNPTYNDKAATAPPPISAPSNPAQTPNSPSSSNHNNHKQEAASPSRFVVVKLEPSGDIKNYGFIQTLDSAAITRNFTTIAYNQFTFWNTWCHGGHPAISNDPMQCWSIWLKIYLETKDFHGTDCKKEKDLHIMAQEAMVKLWSYPYLESLDANIKAVELPEFHRSISRCLEHQGLKNYVANLTEKHRYFIIQMIHCYLSWSPYLVIFALLIRIHSKYSRDTTRMELDEEYYRKLICAICGNGKPLPIPRRPITYPTYNRELTSMVN